jgi:chlorite dismutase
MMASPTVPLTLEGSAVLHQMMRVRWPEWRKVDAATQKRMIAETAGLLAEAGEQSGVYSLIGHKGDLMFLHFRKTMEELNEAEWRLARTGLWEFLEPTTSYVSVVELGLYESTQRIYRVFSERGLEPETEAWRAALEEEMARQRTAMAPRLYPAIPRQKYICFYPMDRKRGEEKNWYTVPFGERARMMHEHGMVGRKYADVVKQIISGSIGFDDWEWGVDLFADDAVWFKKLIYEMRFDEVSAVYALFGAFYLGVRTSAAELEALLV